MWNCTIERMKHKRVQFEQYEEEPSLKWMICLSATSPFHSLWTFWAFQIVVLYIIDHLRGLESW